MTSGGFIGGRNPTSPHSKVLKGSKMEADEALEPDATFWRLIHLHSRPDPARARLPAHAPLTQSSRLSKTGHRGV